jgi:F-type H+-transporting ATPase subunit delta
MDLGEELHSLDKIAEDFLTIEATVHGSRELRAMLHSPVVKPLQKQSILQEIFGKQLHPETLSFITLLVKKGRSELLMATAQEFRRLLDVRRNITTAQVTSAVALTEAEQLTIQAKLESMSGKRVRSTFSIDPSLKGGFTARIGDTLVDASLKHQLEILREQFQRGGSAVLN